MASLCSVEVANICQSTSVVLGKRHGNDWAGMMPSGVLRPQHKQMLWRSNVQKLSIFMRSPPRACDRSANLHCPVACSDTEPVSLVTVA